MKSKKRCCLVVIGLMGIVSVLAMSGCGKSRSTSGTVSVSCSKDQMEIWNAFVQEAKANDWTPVILYTRKRTPVRSLGELKAKDEFAICAMYSSYSSVMLSMLGHKKDDLVGLQVCGGHPDTLDDPKLRLYLAFEQWEKELNSYGWVRVDLVEQ